MGNKKDKDKEIKKDKKIKKGKAAIETVKTNDTPIEEVKRPEPAIGELWLDRKGRYHYILAVAFDESSDDKLVIYKCMYGKHRTEAMSYDKFMGKTRATEKNPAEYRFTKFECVVL